MIVNHFAKRDMKCEFCFYFGFFFTISCCQIFAFFFTKMFVFPFDSVCMCAECRGEVEKGCACF